ncbi:MAG: MFS transporter, partial [Pseudomonadota bacterium]
GRAISIAVLGFAAAEATLPFLGALALTAYPWRGLWWMAAGVIVLVLLPVVALLARELRARGLDRPVEGSDAQGDVQGYQWSRGEVMRDPRFFALLPGVLASPFIITGVLFHQVRLVETKGWTLQGFAATYPLYAGASTLVVVGLGFLVDKFGARRVLPFYLLPLALGLWVLSVTSSLVGAGVFMALMGASAGGATLVIGALWAELYGVRHLGAIRALAVSLMVFSTALAPGMMGLAIDAGVSLDWQYRGLMAYVLVSVGLFAAVQPVLRHRAPRASDEEIV